LTGTNHISRTAVVVIEILYTGWLYTHAKMASRKKIILYHSLLRPAVFACV